MGVCATRRGTDQTPSEGPSCHMSSFRRQEMDVLHFTAHNICRGNHSASQRACGAVLKLSIVLAVMSLAFFRAKKPTRGRRAQRSRRRGELPRLGSGYCSSARQQRWLESAACRMNSRALGEMAVTRRGIEVKICQNETLTEDYTFFFFQKQGNSASCRVLVLSV